MSKLTKGAEMRVDLSETTPEVMRAMSSFQQAAAARAEAAGLEPELCELVKIRASQLNGCAFCLDMHVVEARKLGVTDRRIDLLPAWHEAALYSARERAALAVTEAITFVSDGQVPDDVWTAAAEVFTTAELASLTWVATVINTWNRLMITARRPILRS